MNRGRLRSDTSHDQCHDERRIPSVLAGRPKFLFTSWNGALDDASADVYVVNVDGSGRTQLTTDPKEDSFPTWSPDGKRIAFQSARDGNEEIYVMNADGTGQTRLTDSPTDDGGAVWR